MNTRFKRICDPSGCWEYNQLIGAKVRLKSTSVSNFFGAMTSVNERLTISNIFFRITLDGKTLCLIEVSEIPGKVFTLRDLEVIEINNPLEKKPICGETGIDEGICGYNTEINEVFLKNKEVDSPGILVINEDNTVISGKIIKIIKDKIEDITNTIDPEIKNKLDKNNLGL